MNSRKTLTSLTARAVMLSERKKSMVFAARPERHVGPEGAMMAALRRFWISDFATSCGFMLKSAAQTKGMAEASMLCATVASRWPLKRFRPTPLWK